MSTKNIERIETAVGVAVLATIVFLLACLGGCQPDLSPAPGSFNGGEPGTGEVSSTYQLAQVPCYPPSEYNGGTITDTAWLLQSNGTWLRFRLRHTWMPPVGQFAGYWYIDSLSAQLYYAQNSEPGTICWDRMPNDWPWQWNTCYAPSMPYCNGVTYLYPGTSQILVYSGMHYTVPPAAPLIQVYARFLGEQYNHRWSTSDGYHWTKDY